MSAGVRKETQGNPALGAMAAPLPDIAGYLRTQGFGPREMATLEVADSVAIAGRIAFELNAPHLEELAKAVADMITAAKEEERLLLRTRGVLANDLAWAFQCACEALARG